MSRITSPAGWQKLAAGWPWFRGEDSYPLPGYSEVFPPPRLVRKPYGTVHPHYFSDADPLGWPVTEYEEQLEILPGLRETASEVLGVMTALSRGEPDEVIATLLPGGNPYWPDELARQKVTPPHERFVLLMPLALSQTQDEYCRVLWTIMGGSEQGPGRAFWQSFATGPDEPWSEERGLAFLRRLLNAAYKEPERPTHDLFAAGLRILPSDASEFPGWDDGPLPTWAEPFVWEPSKSLRGVKYLLTFRPFATLPAPVRRAYREGRLHLLPFPGSLLFWGARGYLKLREELPLAMQIPLQDLLHPRAGYTRLRVPQAGWIEEPGPNWKPGHGPIRNKVRMTHRPERQFWDENDPDALEEPLAKVLFSTRPEDLGLYNKPLGRNVQMWTADYHLLLDGPQASFPDLEKAAQMVGLGGQFGYRFGPPAMRVGTYELYWHRPLVACRAGRSGRCTMIDEAPLGYLTAYPYRKPDPTAPAEILWPRLLNREAHAENVALFRHARQEVQQHTMTNVRKLLDAHEMRAGPLPRPFARRLLTLEPKATFESWLKELPAEAADPARGLALAETLRGIVEPAAKAASPPKSRTFARTAKRSFEVAFWKEIVHLSCGPFVNKNNGDCCIDPATQARLVTTERGLERLAKYLRDRHTEAIERAGMTGRAYVGDHVFKWKTEWPYPWLGGWVANQEGKLNERNVIVVIPGRDRSRAVIMADHYDTAFMRDVFSKAEGGDGARISTGGSNDNCSATATLLLAAPILLRLSKEGKLEQDVWLVHITGEEFPTDGTGTRRLCQDLVQGTLRLQDTPEGTVDLSDVRVTGVYVLDMISHRTNGPWGVFQISPGAGREALALAEIAHEAAETWNAWVPLWNKRAGRKGRGKRSADPMKVPAEAAHAIVHGEVRPPIDPRSTLYNADSQSFSDAGLPVVLFMEDYDITRMGYHDTYDNMAYIDLDYGSALAAIAIESVARAATREVE